MAAAGDAVRDLLDAGRYDEAETAASALVESAGGLSERERLAARQLLVDALIRNGRGAEPRTLALARTLLPRTGGDARTREDGVSLRLLGQGLFEPISRKARPPSPVPCGSTRPLVQAVRSPTISTLTP